MKTATYSVHTEGNPSQQISIDYLITPEPMNVISKWCDENSLRTFNCIAPVKIGCNYFSWTYKASGDVNKNLVCFAERMT